MSWAAVMLGIARVDGGLYLYDFEILVLLYGAYLRSSVAWMLSSASVS